MKTIEQIANEKAGSMDLLVMCRDPVSFAIAVTKEWQAQHSPVGYVGKHIAHAIHGGAAGLTTITKHMAFDDDVAIYLATPPAVTAWISVDDRLPEDETPVLAWIGDEAITAAYWRPGKNHCGEAGWADTFSNDDLTGVTHWMKLPEPPAQVEE